MSGIDRIMKRRKPLTDWTQNELQEFVRRLEADDFTFERYEGIAELRVWQLLALHQFLDPAVLGLNRKGRLGELKRAAKMLLPSSTRLLTFVADVPIMLEDIEQGELVCVKETGNLLQSFTTPERFKSYVMKGRLSVYPQRARKKESSPVDPASLPPILRDIWEGMERWKTVDQGGTVIPGCRSTEPDLMPFFVDRGYSVHQSKVLASLCRPPTAHIGRPPKEPSHSSVFPGLARSMRKA